MPTYGSGDLRNTFLNGKAAMYFSVTSSNIAKYVLAEMQDEVLFHLPKGQMLINITGQYKQLVQLNSS